MSPLRRTTHRRHHLGIPSARLTSSQPPMGRSRVSWQGMGCRHSHRSRSHATASCRPQTRRRRPTIRLRRCLGTPSCLQCSTPMTGGSHPEGRQERGCRHSHRSRSRSTGSRVRGMRQPHRSTSSQDWGPSSRPHRCLDIPSDRILSIPWCMGSCLDRFLMGCRHTRLHLHPPIGSHPQGSRQRDRPGRRRPSQGNLVGLSWMFRQPVGSRPTLVFRVGRQSHPHLGPTTIGGCQDRRLGYP